MKQIFAIAFAGAIGCVARFLLSQSVQRFFDREFPYGTLLVNIIGCLLMGFLFTIFLERLVSPIWRATILIGFLGGFTTFSSFTMDSINLFENGNYIAALSYIFASVIFCLAATILGVGIGRSL